MTSPPQQVRDKLKTLDQELDHHNDLYYNQDAPKLSDAAFDALKQERENLLVEFPELKKETTLTPVGHAPGGALGRVTHLAPLYSLDNVFNASDLQTFLEKIQRFLGTTDPLIFQAEPKIDGLSLALLYENGTLTRAATRGNGTWGENITPNARYVSGIPQNLGPDAPPLIEIRGEAFISKKAFLALNQTREQEGEALFANPRNAAAGSLRQLDPEITRSRNLSFLPHGFHSPTPWVTSYEKALQNLITWGFRAPHMKSCQSSEDILAFHQETEQTRSAIDFDIDGTVYKLDDLSLWTRLGHSHKAPRFAFAFKFDPESATTRLLSIEIQVGRLGTLTPVAHLEPVGIGGVLVTRASLHNEDDLHRKDIRVTDTVVVKRAGDVIPQVERAVPEKRLPGAQPFQFPSHCPVCGSSTRRAEGMSAFLCTGGLSCKAQALGRLRHFVSRNAFDIAGCGDKNIAFFWAEGLVRSPADFFTLEARDKENKKPLASYEGWGALSVQNLFEAINEKKRIPFGRFLYALGVPQIGIVAARLIAQTFVRWNTLWTRLVKEPENARTALEQIHGLGPLGAEALITFSKDPAFQNLVSNLLLCLEVLDFEEARPQNETPLTGKTIVFTGTLTRLTRPAAIARAQAVGARVASTLSRKTDFLILGDAPGSKAKKAKTLGVQVMTEERFLECT